MAMVCQELFLLVLGSRPNPSTSFLGGVGGPAAIWCASPGAFGASGPSSTQTRNGGGGGARGSGVALRRLGPAEADVIRRPLPRHLISEAGLSELRLQVRPATGKGVPPWVGDPM